MSSQLRVRQTPNFSLTLQKSLDRHDVLVFIGLHDFFTADLFREILFWTNDIPFMVQDSFELDGNRICMEFADEEQIYLLDLRKAPLESIGKDIGVHTAGLNGKLLVLCNQDINIETVDLPLVPALASFMLHDLQFTNKEMKTIFAKQGGSDKEFSSFLALTGGDVALVMHVLANYKENAGFNLERAKKEILRSYTVLLEKSFGSEELKWICMLRYFDSVDLSLLEQIWPEKLDQIGLIARLGNLGMVLQPTWDTYSCSSPFRLSLERLVYVLCNHEEKNAQEDTAIRFLRQMGQWEKALSLVSVSEHPNMLREVLHEVLSDMDIVSEQGSIRVCYDILKNGKFPESPELLLLNLLHEEYVGQCSAKWRFATRLAAVWEECKNRSESFRTTAAILIVSSALQQGQHDWAKNFLKTVQEGIAFENEGNLAQLELLNVYIDGIMNLDAVDQQKMRKVKRSIMSHGDINVWIFFMRTFFEEDVFLLLFTPDEYEHFFETVLSKKRKDISEEQWLIQQIFYHLYCIGMRRFPSDSDDQEVMLTYKIENSSSDFIKMWGHYMLAQGKLSRNELNLAGTHIDEMLFHVGMVGCSAMRFKGLLMGARIAVENNRLERAERLLREARAMEDYCQLDSYESLLLQEEALWYYRNEEHETAIECAERSLAGIRKIVGDTGVMESLFRISMLLESSGDEGEAEAREYLRDAASIARRSNNMPLLERYLEEYPQLMKLVDQDKIIDEEIEKPDDCELNIMLFSECQIRFGEEVLHEEDWPTRKVKGIFQYLLLHSDQRIARSSLAKAFWPEITDATQGLANLRVALSLLGKTLGRIDLEHILKRNRHRAWLEIPEGARIDYFIFQESYDAGKKYYKQRDYRNAKKHFSASLKVLEEPFLSTQVKDKWAEKEKAKVAKKKERCQYYLLHIALANQQYANAVVYCKKMLEENSYREDIYHILINTLRKQGRVGEALNAYKCYKKILNEDLKLSPSKDMLVMEKKLANTVY